MKSHRLTHLPFQPWCEECVSGKAKQDQHRRNQATEKEGTGVVQMDYFFLSPEKEEEVEDESRLVTILCMTDTVTGWAPGASASKQVPRGCTVQVLSAECGFVSQELGVRQSHHPTLMVSPQSEHWQDPFKSTLDSSRVSVRDSPPKQHQSQGAVESMNGFVASQIRALWLDVRKRYPSLDVSSNITPWLVRHAAWLIARFHTRSRDGMTPYAI